jgi:hypothetical protein
LKLQCLRSQFGSDHFRITNLGGRFHRRQMLSHQAGLLASGTDSFNSDRFAGDCRQPDRRPKDLTTAFALRSVNCDHLCCGHAEPEVSKVSHAICANLDAGSDSELYEL